MGFLRGPENVNVPSMRFPLSASRFFLVWLAMAVAMSANGVFRELGLRRVLGSIAADVVSALLGVTLIALITGVAFRPLHAHESTVNLLSISVALVLLTVVFETAVGRWVDHKSWSELAAHHAISRGELWPLVLAFLALTPFIWGRWLHTPA